MMKSVILVLLVGAFVCSSSADCNIVPMKEWAGEESHRADILTNPVGLVIIQHTVTPEAVSDEECEGLVRAIRKYHMNVLNFDDIGQSFLICGTGKVYEGAGWARVGAHTRYHNNKSIGVAFIGDFTSAVPTQKALQAVHNLLSCGVANGHLKENYKLVGHRQVSQTKSPGDSLQKEIEKWPQWSNQQA